MCVKETAFISSTSRKGMMPIKELQDIRNRLLRLMQNLKPSLQAVTHRLNIAILDLEGEGKWKWNEAVQEPLPLTPQLRANALPDGIRIRSRLDFPDLKLAHTGQIQGEVKNRLNSALTIAQWNIRGLNDF